MRRRILQLRLGVSSLLVQLRQDEDGQGLSEYALLLVLIAVVAIAALTFMGGQVSKELSTIASSVP
jgi:pilus assembly protein Flp/PilA